MSVVVLDIIVVVGNFDHMSKATRMYASLFSLSGRDQAKSRCNRPSLPLIDFLKAKSSPDKHSKCGSTSIFEQTSLKVSAVMSLTSLCRIAG